MTPEQELARLIRILNLVAGPGKNVKVMDTRQIGRVRVAEGGHYIMSGKQKRVAAKALRRYQRRHQA